MDTITSYQCHINMPHIRGKIPTEDRKICIFTQNIRKEMIERPRECLPLAPTALVATPSADLKRRSSTPALKLFMTSKEIKLYKTIILFFETIVLLCFSKKETILYVIWVEFI